MTAPTLETRYADKIAKLRAQAESVIGTPEAEAFLDKAAELMLEYSITEDLIRAASGQARVDEVVQDQDSFNFSGMFKGEQRLIAVTIVKQYGCKVILKHPTKEQGKTVWGLYVIGYASDIEAAKMLNASVQLQAISELSAWWKVKKEECHWLSGGEKFRERRTFMFGFEEALSQRLKVSLSAAMEHASKTEVERTGCTTEAADNSVALALRSRADNVKDWYDSEWGGKLRKTRSVGYLGGSWDSRGAGRSAGSRVDVGSRRISTRKAIA